MPLSTSWLWCLGKSVLPTKSVFLCCFLDIPKSACGMCFVLGGGARESGHLLGKACYLSKETESGDSVLEVAESVLTETSVWSSERGAPCLSTLSSWGLSPLALPQPGCFLLGPWTAVMLSCIVLGTQRLRFLQAADSVFKSLFWNLKSRIRFSLSALSSLSSGPPCCEQGRLSPRGEATHLGYYTTMASCPFCLRVCLVLGAQ